MSRIKKQVSVIEQNGAKTVAKKKSFVSRTKQIFLIVSVIWLALVIWFPLHVKNTYSQPIKQSIVVSMFFDLQRNIVAQYEQLLKGIEDAIDLEKPISFAVAQVRVADNAVDKVTDTMAKAKDATNDVRTHTEKAKKLSGFAGIFGINTGGLDKAIDTVDDGLDQADKAVAKVDDTAKIVNQKLDDVEKQLTSVLRLEFDKMIDDAIKTQLDQETGGLGTTLLTNYGIEHVYPWRPSSWPVATKIYTDLERSDVSTITVLTDTVNTYFGYVAWGLVIAVWAIGLLLWFMLFKKVKAVTAPFIVCPRCGNTFTDKRTAYGLLKVFQPWKWL